MPVFRHYRRWAFESAALDLALRQAGRSLARGARPRAAPGHASSSRSRLGEPPTHRAGRRAGSPRYPGLRFKLDAHARLGRRADRRSSSRPARSTRSTSRAPTRARRSTSTPTRRSTAAIAEAFPDAWLEDPDLDRPRGARRARAPPDRITWDAPIHSVADIRGARRSRRGRSTSSRRASARSRRCSPATTSARQRGIGRLRRRPVRARRRPRADPVLAALFHPDAPNDIAPGGLRRARSRARPARASPLDPRPEPTGFRRRT